ncbi:MAG: FkbM family methyltransferase [Phycisphaerales bacterium]|nr:FkbM family methyltransferase [Phycisphaerales bacterium]
MTRLEQSTIARADETRLERDRAPVPAAAARRAGAVAWLLWRRGNKELVRRTLRFVKRPVRLGLRLETLGSGYGGWTIPVDLVRPDWVCYCVGVGCDATFDLALRERFGCEVHCFDPTPRAINYMLDLDASAKGLTFHTWGLWTSDTTMRFFAPADKRKTSHSVLDLNGTGEYFNAECLGLDTMKRRLGHDRVDLLKIDIEGAWRPVVEQFAAHGVTIPVLCVEFDSPTSVLKVLRAIRALGRAGYHLAHYQKENFLFIHDSALPSKSEA